MIGGGRGGALFFTKLRIGHHNTILQVYAGYILNNPGDTALSWEKQCGDYPTVN